jgi:hypothetical protein
VNYSDRESIKDSIKNISPENQAEAKQLFELFCKNEKLNDDFDKKHLNIEFINFEKNVLMGSLNDKSAL